MQLEDIREICMAMPGVTEDVKWGDHLCFSVVDKLFIITGSSEVPVTASFKTSDEDFAFLADRPGFKPAPYMARNKWIWTEDINNFTRKEWEEYLGEAYEIVKAKLPKKVRETL